MKDIVLAIFAAIGILAVVVVVALVAEQVYLWKIDIESRLERLERGKELLNDGE